MRYARLGPFDAVSRLTLGGGGIGALWGETSETEGLLTLRAALDAGVNLIDTAPIYRDCERLVGAAFEGRPPAGVRFTSKVYLGSPPPGAAAARIEASLAASLAAMRLERADLYFLHTNICEDAYVYARGAHRQDTFATRWSIYCDEVIPCFERLQAQGRIGAWGVTATGVPATILRALGQTPKPAVGQMVTNLLDSCGDMRSYAEPAEPRRIIAEAAAQGVGVMGIRAVQAGALTRNLDRELRPGSREQSDFERALPFRRLCEEIDADPAEIAHRYALGMEGVDTVVLGVKNRAELAQCLEAERKGPLEADLARRIDALGLALAD